VIKPVWHSALLPSSPGARRLHRSKKVMRDEAQRPDDQAVAFYASGLDAFYATGLEQDKSILALSAGGIGLLITLLTTVGVTSLFQLAGYLSGITCFAVAVLLILVVFAKSKKHIIEVVSNTYDIENRTLQRLDKSAMLFFGLGAMCSALVGVSAALYSYHQPKDSEMADKKITNRSGWVAVGDSAEGIQNLRPDVLKQRTQQAASIEAKIKSGDIPISSSRTAASTPVASTANKPSTKTK
jgi:hypothetical protein